MIRPEMLANRLSSILTLSLIEQALPSEQADVSSQKPSLAHATAIPRRDLGRPAQVRARRGRPDNGGESEPADAS